MQQLCEKITVQYRKDAALEYLIENNLHDVVGPIARTVFNKLAAGDSISIAEADAFENYLAVIKNDINTYNFYIGLMNFLCFQIIQHHENELKAIAVNIEKQLSENEQSKALISQQIDPKYIQLLDAYRLSRRIKLMHPARYRFFPKLPDPEQKQIDYDIPLGLNALRLSGMLPKEGTYQDLDLSKPFYPEKLARLEKLPLKPGIKISDDYFPFKRISKLFLGDTGDNTIAATNGKKILFVRGVERYAPNSVLASKVATVVSQKHFSSERLLDNRLAASRQHPGYQLSLATKSALHKNKVNLLVGKQKHLFDGTGVIDEIMNFLGESDRNIENYAYSNPADLAKSYLVKIDFDRCDVSAHMALFEYETNCLSTSTIYCNSLYQRKDIPGHQKYIAEKLRARLKLILMPRELFAALADKAYTDKGDKQEAVVELTRRTSIAFKLFSLHSHSTSFRNTHPAVVTELYHELVTYVDSHNFSDEDTKERVKTALYSRAAEINHLLTPKNQLYVQDRKPASPKTTLFQRNKGKLLGTGLLISLGIGLGIGLVATGFLAPFGVGLAGVSIMAAMGGGAGALCSAITFGIKMVIDEHCWRHPQGEIILDDQIEPILPCSKVVTVVEGLLSSKEMLSDQGQCAAASVAHIGKRKLTPSRQPPSTLEVDSSDLSLNM